MQIDLNTRLTFGFVFGLVGLGVELVAGIFGAPVSQAVVGGCVGIVLATFGVGALKTPHKDRDGAPEEEAR